MLLAERKNRVLRIPDEKKEEYIRLGYSISTADGQMVYQHMNQEQKLAFAESENEKLKAENEKLKAEIAEAQKYVPVQEKTIGKDTEEQNAAGKKTAKSGKKSE